MSERFKVTIKDKITGEKTTFHVHSAGFGFHERTAGGKTELVRLVLEHPRKKIKSKK